MKSGGGHQIWSDTVADSAESTESNTTRRRSPREKNLKYDTFKGMQGSGPDEHYKVGKYGGGYIKAAMKYCMRRRVPGRCTSWCMYC